MSSTYTVVPKFSAKTLYDPANGITSSGDPNISDTCIAPHVVGIAAVPTGTTIVLEGKLLTDGAWVELSRYTDTTEPALYFFPTRLNYVRVRRESSGAPADVRVDAQGV